MHIALAIFLLQTIAAPRDAGAVREPPLQGTVVARFVVTVPVDPPTMLVAAAASPRFFGLLGRTVKLTWKASPDQGVKNWSGYFPYRATGATGTFAALTTKPVTALTYKDTTAKKGQPYRYYVLAAVRKVVSKPSNVVSVTP
jgi:hypothetical protein